MSRPETVLVEVPVKGIVEAIIQQLVEGGTLVEVVRCKDCKHQEKTFHADKRMKNGGYYVYFCDLAEEYSHVCLDDDFCSKGERRDDGDE